MFVKRPLTWSALCIDIIKDLPVLEYINRIINFFKELTTITSISSSFGLTNRPNEGERPNKFLLQEWLHSILRWGFVLLLTILYLYFNFSSLISYESEVNSCLTDCTIIWISFSAIYCDWRIWTILRTQYSKLLINIPCKHWVLSSHVTFIHFLDLFSHFECYWSITTKPICRL